MPKNVRKVLKWKQKKKFFMIQRHTFHNFSDDPYLLKEGSYGVLRRCLPYKKIESVIYHFHRSKYEGHFGGTRTTSKVLKYGFYCPSIFKDAFLFVKMYDKCQRVGNNSKRDMIIEMPGTNYVKRSSLCEVCLTIHLYFLIFPP